MQLKRTEHDHKSVPFVAKQRRQSKAGGQTFQKYSVMNSMNNLPCTALTQMHTEILTSKQHIKHYKHLYQAECVNSRKILKKFLALKNANAKLYSEIQELRNLCTRNTAGKEQKHARKHKQWHEIQHDCTKRRRLAQYKSEIFATLMKIPDCHRAEINLWIHGNRLHFTWFPKDFQKGQCTVTSEVQTNDHDYKVHHDHTYTCKETDIIDDEETYEDIDYSEIFDSQGQWKVHHIR